MTAPLFLGLTILGITLLGWTSQWLWPSWIMDLVSSFQVQYAIANLLLWLLLLKQRFTRRSQGDRKHQNRVNGGLLLGLLCLTFQISLLGHWYRPAAAFAAAAAPQTVKILSINTHPGLKDFEPLVQLIEAEKPDLVLFQEATSLTLEAIKPLKPLLPYHLDKVPPGPQKPGQKYPPQGTALFSRFPLSAQTTEPGSPLDKAGISAHVQIGSHDADGFQIFAIHALVPLKPNFYRQRNNQLTAVFAAANELDLPAIAMGDFNAAIWSPALNPVKTQKLSSIRQGFGIMPSWRPSVIFPRGWQWLSLPFSIPIDHCYISPDIAVRDFRIGPDVKSDHLPLIAELQIPVGSSRG